MNKSITKLKDEQHGPHKREMNSRDTDNIGEHAKNKNNKHDASQTTDLSNKRQNIVYK